MLRLAATIALWATLAILTIDASIAGATGVPEKSVPQGHDPPGADNGEQQTPVLPEYKGVIPPPPIGDEDIYTEAPNPEAGHEKEVIPLQRQKKSRGRPNLTGIAEPVRVLRLPGPLRGARSLFPHLAA
jgi:hypothetical protein